MTVWGALCSCLPQPSAPADEEEPLLQEDKKQEEREANLLKACLRSLGQSQPFSGSAFATREWLLITDAGTSEFVTVLPWSSRYLVRPAVRASALHTADRWTSTS